MKHKDFTEGWFTGSALALALLIVALPAQAQTSPTLDDKSFVTPVVHDSWSSGAPMPTARQGVATGVIDGRVYVVSGATDSGVVAVNEIYNPKKNTWTTGASIPTARFVPASAVVNNILYVIGGCTSACATGTGAMTVVEAYNPATNTWSTKAPLPTATDSMYAVAVKGIIYVVGGYVPGVGRVGTVHSYNPTTDTWTEETPLRVGKSSPALGTLGTKILAAGGLGNSDFVSDNEAYNSTKKSWKTLASDPTARAGSCFGVIAGQFYVAGGGNPSLLSLVESYSAKTNSWTTLASMPEAAVHMGSAHVSGRLYCFGGSDTYYYSGTGPVYNYVQIYQP